MRRPEAGLPVDQPRLRLTVGGVVVPGVMALEVESLGYFSANRFRVELAVGADPLLPTAFFATLQAATVLIEVALDASGLLQY